MLIVKRENLLSKEANELVMNGSALNYQNLDQGKEFELKKSRFKNQCFKPGDLIKKWNLFGADKNLLDLVSAMARRR